MSGSPRPRLLKKNVATNEIQSHILRKPQMTKPTLPHPGGGEVPAGSPRAIGDPSRQPQGNPHLLFSLLRKEIK
jgi:hypothetical protein